MKKSTLCRCGALLAAMCLLLTACSKPNTDTASLSTAVAGGNESSQSSAGQTLSDTAKTGSSSMADSSGSLVASRTGGNSKPSANGGGSAATNSKDNNASKDTAAKLLNSVSLNPTRTNCTALDRKVDEVFSKIIKPGMSTYEKVKACYDYLVKNGKYSQNVGFDDPVNGIFYDSALDTNIVQLAYGILLTGKGVCDHYSAAFVVMTRAIGLDSFFVAGQVRSKGGGYTGHAWVNIRINGTYYIFDPQVQQNNSNTPYYFFCKTDAQMGNMYKYENRNGMISQFHNFRYYSEISASITVNSGGKLYKASLSQSSSAENSNVFKEGVSVGGDGSYSISVTPSGGTGQYTCLIGYYWQPGYYVEKNIKGSETFNLKAEPGTNKIQVTVQDQSSDPSMQGAVIFEFSVSYNR